MFLGIKYAPTPTRFEPAKPALSFVGVADATAFGDICFQDPHGVSLVSPNSTQSEDCLHYNIFRPQGANTPLPVLFWVHGGGFISGSGGDGDASDKSGAGSTLARRQKSIVVTINYRLGPLGFLVKDPASSTPGGFNGIRDVIQALRFTKAFIHDFGGDPDRVTMFGESAGGCAVCLLSIAPAAAGLFRNAIIESGPCVGNW